ncbi:MAG: hypothetical protein ACYS5F_13080 [Planctomycetota bacterium]
MISRIKSFKNWILGRAEEKPVTIEVFITDETTKTIQVDYKDQVTWLQKSLVKIKQQDGNKVTITIPLWLFTRKFPRLKY